MKQDSTRNAAYTVDCEDYVHVIKFNPFDSGDACSLIAYGGNNYVVVGTCRFQEEDAEMEGMQYKTLRTFHHGIRVDAIAWSPETRLDALPPRIRFCTAASDRKLRLFTSDLQDKNEYKTFDGHSDYINDLVFAPKEGQEVASVSDDHTCRYHVCWRYKETLRIFKSNFKKKRKKNACWSSIRVVTHKGENSSMCALPLGIFERYVHFIHRWSRVNENLFATTGYPGKTTTQLLVHHLGHPQVNFEFSFWMELHLCFSNQAHKYKAQEVFWFC
uniref:Nucleoporin 37 n=1 Tax=Anser brachyrhynchus TaxID=132585 RepID=A0A8B9C3C7_9AVES